MKSRPVRYSAGFSLAETVIAIGVVTFAILGLVSMLPLGLNLAHNSTEEIQAADLISAITADLRNTPSSSPESVCFEIRPLPWQQNSGSGGDRPNPSIEIGRDYVFYFDPDRVVLSSESTRARYRVTLRYTRIPGQADPFSEEMQAGTSDAVEAIAIVSWPAAIAPFSMDEATPLGQVETYLTFLKP